MFYIEEDLAVDMTPSMETLLFRRAFAGSHYLRSSNIEFDELEGRNNEIANLINEQFFMMACFHDHAYAKAVRSLVRNHIQQLTTSLPSASLLMDEESYPMLVVLAPSEEDYEAYAQHQAALVSFEYDTKRLEQQVETDAINNTPNNLQDKKLRKKLEKEKRKIRNRKKPVLTLPSMLSKKKGGDSLEVLGVMKIPTELIVFATEGADDLDFSESTFADENDINATKHREKLIRTRLKERLAICEENVSKSVLQFLQQVLQEHTDRLQLLPQYVERAHIEEAERQASQDAMMESEEGAAVDVELLEYQQYPGQIDHSIDTTTSLSSQDIDANAAVEEREGIESTQKS